MRISIKNLVLLVVIIQFCATSCSYKRKITANKISVSSYYSSNMVFMRGEPIVLEGKCEPEKVVGVRIEDALKYAKSDKDGNWKVSFPAIDYTGTFKIIIHGISKEIVLENVTTGLVWVVIGDAWLKDNIATVFKKKLIGGTNGNVRYFQPKLNYNKNVELKGEWKPVKGGLIFNNELFARTVGESLNESFNIPVGIINLAWPGMDIRNLSKQLRERLNDKSGNVQSDSLWIKYFNNQTDYIFLADSSYRGIGKGVIDRRFDDELWSETDFPVIADKRWYLKNRIVWWRKKIFVPNKYITSDFLVDLGVIRGDFDFYFNGIKLKSYEGESNNFEFVVPDSLIKTWTNVLAVRMVAGDSLSGFYSRNSTVTNADSSFNVNISKQWKFITYYEPVLPETKRSNYLVPPFYENYLDNKINAKVNGVLLAGSASVYSKAKTENITEALQNISESFPSNKKFIYLIPSPAYVDSIINSDLFNSIRNKQLLASAKADWQIINTLDVNSGVNQGLFYEILSQKLQNTIGH